MHKIYHPTESELMNAARRALSLRALDNGHAVPATIPLTPADLHGPAPARQARRQRPLRSCHRPAHREKGTTAAFKDSGAFVPETAARIEDDPNLTDGARRCARKIMEETYRRNREGRTLAITVSYLARALGRCRRSVQRYLRALEEQGYLAIDVACGARSRLCTGLVIRLGAKLFPRHHRERWPGTLRNPGATAKSQNQRVTILIARESWALRCMDGVFRSLMKTNPLAGLRTLAC